MIFNMTTIKMAHLVILLSASAVFADAIKTTKVIHAHKAGVIFLDYDSNTGITTSASFDGFVFQWDKNFKQIRKFPNGAGVGKFSAAINGSILYFIDRGRDIQIWDISTQKKLKHIKSKSDKFSCLDFGDNGLLVCGTRNGYVYTYDSKYKLLTSKKLSKESITFVRVSKNKKWLFCSIDYSAMAIYTLKNYTLHISEPNSRNLFIEARFHGDICVYGTSNGIVRILNCKTKKYIFHYKDPESRTVTALDTTPKYFIIALLGTTPINSEVLIYSRANKTIKTLLSKQKRRGLMSMCLKENQIVCGYDITIISHDIEPISDAVIPAKSYTIEISEIGNEMAENGEQNNNRLNESRENEQ